MFEEICVETQKCNRIFQKQLKRILRKSLKIEEKIKELIMVKIYNDFRYQFIIFDKRKRILNYLDENLVYKIKIRYLKLRKNHLEEKN